MLRFLPLCLLLAACGGDEADPVVVSDTDIAVVDVAPDTLVADGDVEMIPADGPADDGPSTADVVEPAPAPPPPPPAPAVTPDPVPAGLANLPGETLYFMGDQETTIMLNRGADAMTGRYTLRYADLDPSEGTWTIEGNTLRIGSETYTFKSVDESGTSFSGPNGDVKFTVAAG